VLTLEGSVAARNHLGGTAPAQVRAAIARTRRTDDGRQPRRPQRPPARLRHGAGLGAVPVAEESRHGTGRRGRRAAGALPVAHEAQSEAIPRTSDASRRPRAGRHPELPAARWRSASTSTSSPPPRRRSPSTSTALSRPEGRSGPFSTSRRRCAPHSRAIDLGRAKGVVAPHLVDDGTTGSTGAGRAADGESLIASTAPEAPPLSTPTPARAADAASLPSSSTTRCMASAWRSLAVASFRASRSFSVLTRAWDSSSAACSFSALSARNRASSTASCCCFSRALSSATSASAAAARSSAPCRR
jgi:hypothetical protein